MTNKEKRQLADMAFGAGIVDRAKDGSWVYEQTSESSVLIAAYNNLTGEELRDNDYFKSLLRKQ